jgi:VWFA-related protein
MSTDQRLSCLLLVTLLCAIPASSHQKSPATQTGLGQLNLDVVVTRKSGAPIAGLEQQDFTVLDNKVPQTITSFKAFTERQAPLEVVVVIDAVNTGYGQVAYERSEIDKFLRADGGHLAYPTSLLVLTDKGLRIAGNLSLDGNELSGLLDRDEPGLRAIGHSTGFYGAAERLQLSVQPLRQLAASLTGLPGRKIVLWVSPGWPLLPRLLPDARQQRQLFTYIADLSTQLLKARVTLYSVDPRSAGAIVNSYYKTFVKGVSKPSQAHPGNLGLQVLAVQSGGLVLTPSNNLASLLRKGLAESAPYYEISFEPPRADKPAEYHRLEIKLAKPGLIGRTRQGYYTQPLPR